MSINNRIKRLEREANTKFSKHRKIDIFIGEWCECNAVDCSTCGAAEDLPSKQYINGEIIINVGVD